MNNPVVCTVFVIFPPENQPLLPLAYPFLTGFTEKGGPIVNVSSSSSSTVSLPFIYSGVMSKSSSGCES